MTKYDVANSSFDLVRFLEHEEYDLFYFDQGS